jgi:hypothetical protein
MQEETIIYSLTVEDIQTVAEESFGRKLEPEEIKQLVDAIAENIPWYDAIENAIIDILKIEHSYEDG